MSNEPSSTTTETAVRTVVLPLETSREKNDAVRTGIDEFQEMCQYFAAMLPSFPEPRWTAKDTTHYRVMTREFDGDRRTVKSTVARDAAAHVADAFTSWRERGKPGNRPQFNGGDYLYLAGQEFELVGNDRGYGLKTSFIPRNPVWFHIDAADYHTKFLHRVFEGDAETGSAELHLAEDGSLACHLVVKWEVEVYESADVSRVVGVDMGENVLYAAAVVDEDDVDTVEMESGREFRHYRERLDAKRERASKAGNLRAVRQCRGERERYTEHILHTASRTIVDLAADHAPATLVLEDLTYYRETADDPIHDWPYAEFQKQIMYKATDAGVPVVTVDPAGTSQTCRHCGQQEQAARNGNEFTCRRCNYEVHADVNAAINIARRYTTPNDRCPHGDINIDD